MPGRTDTRSSLPARLAAAVGLFVLCSPAVLAGPRLALEPERLDFGKVNRGDKASKPLRLANTGDAVLRIDDIRPSCAECTVGDLTARTVAPGERLDLQITFVAVDVPGKHTAHVTLSTNDEAEPLRRVYLDVEIEAVETPRLVVEPERLDLGVVRAGEPLVAEVLLHNVGEAPLRMRDFTCGPRVALDGEPPAELRPDEKRVLKLRLGPPPPGILRSHLAMVTNQPDQRVVTVAVDGYAAKPAQLERLLDGVLVRTVGAGAAVEVVNGARQVAWLTAGATRKLMAPGQKMQLPTEQAADGGRIRLTIELPLPEGPAERKPQ